MAATSVGLVSRQLFLDLSYEEDFRAHVDMNVVMTSPGEFVEVQGTGEGATFSAEQLNQMITLAGDGIQQLIQIQKTARKDLL